MRVSFDYERFSRRPTVWTSFGSKNVHFTPESFLEAELTVSFQHVTITLPVSDWKRLIAAIQNEIKKREEEIIMEMECPFPRMAQAEA